MLLGKEEPDEGSIKIGETVRMLGVGKTVRIENFAIESLTFE